MKDAIRKFVSDRLRAIGWRLSRYRPQSRYQAIDESLELMRDAGYLPRVVIDAGANVGTWTRMASGVFPNATFILIEPQPLCREPLLELAQGLPRALVHSVAVTEPGVSELRMFGEGECSTGAFVGHSGEGSPDATSLLVPALTLDELLADRIVPEDRTLMKLDLESHELTALRGATRCLPKIEVVLTEVTLYDIEGGGRPVFADYVAFLAAAGFDLYDIAALSPRPRDLRLRQADVLFARRDSPLLADKRWA